jgi:hypothetical protein
VALAEFLSYVINQDKLLAIFFRGEVGEVSTYYGRAQERGRTQRDCTIYNKDCPLSPFNLPNAMSNLYKIL